MLHYRRGARRQAQPPRGRGVALVLGACGLAAVLLAGLILSAGRLMPTPGHSSTPSAAASSSDGSGSRSVSASVARARDALAARPMPHSGTGHEFGWPDLSTQDPGPVIVLPPARGEDALGVARGFAHTPPGALAQLAAIDTAAWQSASLPGVRAVISAWAAPGGPTARTWTGVGAMAALLSSEGLSGAGSPQLRITVTPAMGLVKGLVGDDFTVVCVDFSITIADPSPSTSAGVDCQRMLWQDGRWQIGPGPEPAPADQAWPDTNAAVAAGFRDLARP